MDKESFNLFFSTTLLAIQAFHIKPQPCDHCKKPQQSREEILTLSKQLEPNTHILFAPKPYVACGKQCLRILFANSNKDDQCCIICQRRPATQDETFMLQSYQTTKSAIISCFVVCSTECKFIMSEYLGGATICGVCGKEGSVKLCARCNMIPYCSRECQKKDYPRHKFACRATEQAIQKIKIANSRPLEQTEHCDNRYEPSQPRIVN